MKSVEIKKLISTHICAISNGLYFYQAMRPDLDFHKIQALANSVTESEMARYRNYFVWLLKNTEPGGTTLLKHLKKIPSTGSAGECVYEYELSDFFRSFLSFMEDEFKGRNQDLKSAIIYRIVNEQFSNSK